MKFIDSKSAKACLSLAWPISLQSALTSSLSMIDVAMVSHLGNSAVAAVGLGSRFQFVVLVVLVGVAWTVGVLSAQYYGAGKVSEVRTTIVRACLLANAALLPIVLAVFFYGGEAIALGSTSTEVIELGKHYIWIIIPSLFIVSVILILENALRGLGEVKVPMIISIIAIVINIVLNYWFINGGLGVPELGVVGAAIATAVARLIHVLLLVGMIIVSSHVLRVKRADLGQVFHAEKIRHFMSLAVPMMVSFGVWSSGTFVYQIIFGRMGTQELAVMSILSPIEGIVLAIFLGLASSCAITVGQHLGANRFAEAELCARTFSVLSPAVGLVVGVVLLLFRDVILLPFASMPSETLVMARDVYTLVALLMWIKVINMTLSMGILRAGGDNKVCMYIDIIGMWVMSIPLTALAAFYFEWPLYWVVLVAFSEEICKAILFAWRAGQKVWLRNLTQIVEAVAD